MSCSSTQWLACSEDRSRHDLEHRVLLSRSTLPPIPSLSCKFCPHRERAIPARPEAPVSALCSFLPSDIPGCFLCVFVRGHQSHLYSGNLWEGLVGRSHPGVICFPSFNSFLPRTSCLSGSRFFEVSSCLPANSLLSSPPTSTRRTLPALYYEHVPQGCFKSLH